MIPRKLKVCKDCLVPSYIWKHGRCKACAYKADKFSGKQPNKIKPISDKRKEANVEYLKLRLDFLNTHQKCEVAIPWLCKHSATEIHHAKGRTGSLLTDTNHFIATCRACHSYCELNPNWAKENGFSKSRLNNF